ncbi:winged helix-turn-helix domain-containing protein [Haloarcula sp. GH36]|uniref:winged helix-turn-helix domain-containing protein n=1 Tax=Haloarcula montana TaxID=3111776 RepID=UPI002D77C5B0|nr:helix-turn-helix domain-containing protein [Haloarcula sp. GH36]
MSDSGLIETADPDEAFAALADATRVDILRALWDHQGETLTFSELRDAVGVADSGQFNYHLDKLTDRFLTKTDDGYELTLAGIAVNGAIHAGAFTMDGSADSFDLDDACPSCGRSRTFSYQDERVRIECDRCEMVATTMVPPGVFAGYDRERFPEVTSRYFRTIFDQLSNGFCWDCEGRLRTDVQRLSDAHPERGQTDRADLPLVRYECERCGSEITGDLGVALVTHPAVVAFYYDAGVDVRDHAFWEFSAWNTDQAWIEQEEPFRARVQYTVDDATLMLVVDDTLDVTDVERRE